MKIKSLITINKNGKVTTETKSNNYRYPEYTSNTTLLLIENSINLEIMFAYTNKRTHNGTLLMSVTEFRAVAGQKQCIDFLDDDKIGLEYRYKYLKKFKNKKTNDK